MAVGEGLRERKKRRTREEISDVATRLFAEHGFEAVTLAQIAEAAEVSVKTIFNHFGSKEDLYFDRAQEARDALLDAISGRPPGTTILAAVRSLLTDNLAPFPGVGWEGLREPAGYARFAAFLATQDRSPALRARRLTLGEEIGAALIGVLAAALARAPDDPAVEALAAAILAAYQLRDRWLRRAIAEAAPAEEVERRVRAVVDEAVARLATAFADLDRPAA
ncbi:MAG TPA: helix-turn-helix domain-containing protein [Solirubrobacteraceae bacterium]|jgi:AcrR family transcriptional regulator